MVLIFNVYPFNCNDGKISVKANLHGNARSMCNAAVFIKEAR